MDLKPILFSPIKKLNYKHLVRLLQYKPIETENLIRVGHKMARIIDQKRTEYEIKQADLKRSEILKHTSPLIISCKKSQFNHYQGQKYDKPFKDSNMASYGWFNRRSNGDSFTLNPRGPHPGLDDSSDDMKSFAELNVNDQLVEILKSAFNCKSPSKIQSLALDKIRMHKKHHLIVAETGSGKTLSYVLPIVEEVMKSRASPLSSNRMKNSPLAIVIVPTRELAYQAYAVFKTFSTTDLKMRVVLDLDTNLIAAKQQVIDEPLDGKADDQPTDVLITMPNAINHKFMRKRKYLSSVNLKKLVIDESNLLLDDSNNESIIKCLNNLNLNLELKNPEEFDCGTQILFVSATVPKDMENILKGINSFEYDSLELISTANVNKLMLHVPQTFYRLSTETRREKLLEIVKTMPKRDSMRNSLMIFTNKKITAMYVAKLLKENDVDSVLLHGDLPDMVRETYISRFLSGKVRIITCTDILSRGLDTVHVKHVINFEMPTFIADYVHRK